MELRQPTPLLCRFINVSCQRRHSRLRRHSRHISPRHHAHNMRATRSRYAGGFAQSHTPLLTNPQFSIFPSAIRCGRWCRRCWPRWRAFTLTAFLTRGFTESRISRITSCSSQQRPAPLPPPPLPMHLPSTLTRFFFLQVPLVALQFAANNLFLSLAPAPLSGQQPSHFTAFLCGGAAGVFFPPRPHLAHELESDAAAQAFPPS
jgi:hypothetical protein